MKKHSDRKYRKIKNNIKINKVINIKNNKL